MDPQHDLATTVTDFCRFRGLMSFEQSLISEITDIFAQCKEAISTVSVRTQTRTVTVSAELLWVQCGSTRTK